MQCGNSTCTLERVFCWSIPLQTREGAVCGCGCVWVGVGVDVNVWVWMYILVLKLSQYTHWALALCSPYSLFQSIDLSISLSSVLKIFIGFTTRYLE